LLTSIAAVAIAPVAEPVIAMTSRTAAQTMTVNEAIESSEANAPVR
jgi:hypothetical protein